MRNTNDFARAAYHWASRLGERIVPGSAFGAPVDIGRIICPLRYDICVRMDFIRLLRDRPTLHLEDFQSFRRLPATEAYFLWFRNVRSVRYEPSLLRNEIRLEAAFRDRVHQTAALWQSIERDGFDTAKRIRLTTGRKIRNVNGKMIDGRIFSGDGCHRIACLHLLGWKRLEPAHYEVAVRPRFVPLDITSELIEFGFVDRGKYLEFISHFYGDGLTFRSVEQIVQYVSQSRPELLVELRSVLDYDLARLSSMEGSDE